MKSNQIGDDDDDGDEEEGEGASASLPNDLIILHILPRLPIKSIFRCRSVCKSWRHLPFDPQFVRVHSLFAALAPAVLVEIIDPSSSSSSPSSSFLSVDRFGASSAFSLAFLPDRVKLRASCHGLLCCASLARRGAYYVCNPMTRQFRPLPPTRHRPYTRCQPDYEATLVGLAVDPVSPGFRVVLAGFYRPFGHRPHDNLVCLVFDSLAGAWTKFAASPPHHDEFTHMNRNQVVFSGGSLHWLTHSCSHLLALSLRHLSWTKITLPDEILAAGSGARVYLLDLQGSVSLVHISGAWMCTWVLRDQATEQWDAVDRVHLRCIMGIMATVFPISQTEDVVFLATQKKILTYNRRGKVWREVYTVKGASTYPLWSSAHAFRSTLFSCH